MKSKKPLISIVTPCFNEEENVLILYKRIKQALIKIKSYDFEIIFIDNKSTDNTVKILRDIASEDYSVKIIINTRNFGHIRSPYYGILQSRGEATVYLASDLQDPPELIPEFIKEWESGYKLVMGTKPQSKNSSVSNYFRKLYYQILDKISDISIIRDATGFGIYDKIILDKLRNLDEPYPFLRGLISEFGYPIKTIPFVQPRRDRGVTKNNFYSLFDIGMLGVVSHSKVPIRLASFFGFLLGSISVLVGITYTIIKIIFWSSFPIGIAPLAIGVFFLLGVQLMFIGVLGEYIGSIHTYIQRKPLVEEEERINF